MRLANVVKGRIRFVMAMSQYEIDFTVRDKETGKVICAIELDGPTHDTLDGQRRDSNKNKWLADAGIQLVRLRHPNEANDIRTLMEAPIIPSIPPIWRKSKPMEPDLSRLLLKIGAPLAAIFLLWMVSGNFSKNIQNNVATQIQQMQQPNAAQQAEALKQAQAAENLRKQQAAAMAQQAKYERVLVRGKSARECARPDGTLDNSTVKCMSDHYETVLANSHQ